MAEEKKNPWRSVDASGYDWNAGEQFDPAPAQQAATPTATTSVAQTPAPAAQQTAAMPGAQSAPTRLNYADTSNIRSYLEQSRDAAVAEASGQIDRGVTQGVNELRRVQEDANEQYRTQQNQIDLDERRALDNRALYDAARGDRGGIGAEEWSGIQNTAAQNRVTVNNARTKTATEIARQMADLRASGELEKSQAYLQATQQYLAQLTSLEQWAQEFNVGVDKFNAELEQAEREYQLRLKQLEISQSQWQQEFEANRADVAWSQNFQQNQTNIAQNQWQREFDANRADVAWNQNFQKQQADVAQSQWQREFDANRSDVAWNQNFQQQQADASQNRWQQEFDASRSDTAWNQLYQQGQADFQRQQYANAQTAQSKQDAYNLAMTMLNAGWMPDESVLTAARLDKGFAQLYLSSVKAAQELATEQAAVELEGKKADTLKKTAEATKTLSGGTPDASGDIDALAKAFVASGSASPKTWLANNYKAYGFTSKPDAEEFEDAVEEARTNAETMTEESAGEGVSPRFYDLLERRITETLGSGDPQQWTDQQIDSVTQQIDRVWERLSEPQRKALLKFLSRYRLSYKVN